MCVCHSKWKTFESDENLSFLKKKVSDKKNFSNESKVFCIVLYPKIIHFIHSLNVHNFLYFLSIEILTNKFFLSKKAQINLNTFASVKPQTKLNLLFYGTILGFFAPRNSPNTPRNNIFPSKKLKTKQKQDTTHIDFLFFFVEW